MRAYFFGNFYLSSIQQGIQTAHVVAELALTFMPPTATDVCLDSASCKMWDWAENYKTIIILNGGDSLALDELYKELMPIAEQLDLPCAVFQEDNRSLNEATTCVGIVLPESLYDYNLKAELDTISYGIAADIGEIPLSIEGQLKQILNRYRLAQ